MSHFLLVPLAFFLGSLPSAYVIGRWARGADIRCLGNKNPGVANVFRQLGAQWAALTATGDIGKGALAVALGRRASAPELMLLGLGLAALLGHMGTPWLGFRGGIGGATCLGCLLGLLPRPTLAAGLVGGASLLLVRKPALSQAVIFVLVGPLALWMGEPRTLALGYASLALMVGLRAWIWQWQSAARPRCAQEGKGDDQLSDKTP